MAGEPELDNIKEEIPTGITSVDLSGMGYMDDKLTADLTAVLITEDASTDWDVPIQWNYFHACYNEEDGGSYSRQTGEEADEFEYGSVTSKMSTVVSLTVKHNRYGRYAYAGLTMDPSDDKDLPHGFGVRMSPAGLGKAEGGLFENSKYAPLDDHITVSLRRGQVEAWRNKKLVEVLGKAPPGCVSMYAKIFMREPDLQIYVLKTATCCKVSEINLSSNKIEDKGAHSIAEVIEKDTNLIKKIDLSLNRIRDDGAARLSQALKSEMCRVTDLNLSHNSISDMGAQTLAAALEKESCPVTLLDLTDNDIGDPGCIRLAEAFGAETCSVTKVKLALNRIESAGFVSMAEALEQTTCKITDISMGQNRPEKAASKRLAKAFAKVHRLNVA